MERPKLRLPTGTIINGLEEAKAEMPLMKTRGPAAKDTSAFNILHEKIEKWLEAGDSVTDRELVRFRALTFGNPFMRGADFYTHPDHRRQYENDCDMAVHLINSAIETLRITECESLRSPPSKRVFIGHGHSPAWRDLKDFLVDRLGLEYEEFNREPSAGKSTKERLQEMLVSSGFALIVMTGEDEAKDGKVRARENVVHEAGLFQSKLGFERAIVLREEGCEEYSNIAGLIQLQFPRGNIMAVSEQIRRTLEREGFIPKSGK